MSDMTAPNSGPSEKISLATHSTFWVAALCVVVFTVWASISKLDIVSVAVGEVIPSYQVKTVQHLEGGIVREIMVREGSEVKANQPFIVIEPTVSSADVAELRVRLTSLETDIAQFKALSEGKDTATFSDEIKVEYPELVAQAQKRFKTRLARHKGNLNSQEQTVLQRRQEINEIRQRIVGSKKSLSLVSEQVGMSQELLAKNLTNSFRHLDLLKEERTLQSTVEADQAALLRTVSALSEQQAELASIQTTFADEAQKSLETARLQSRELSKRITKFEDSLNRAIVRSPVDGVVKTKHVVTVGGVVRPGDPEVDVVPIGDKLVVEGKLPTQDIGYVANGQAAVVKLASSDAIRFGKLDAQVIEVSPDTLMSPEGFPFYRVRIEIEKSYFENGELRYELFPGMQVIASIHTGERTVLEYILDPLRHRMSNAFQER